MNSIVVSDLHMGSPYFHAEAFGGFLEKLPANYELILNGDVIDRPYLKLNYLHQGILDRIKHISLTQKVVWVRGNHENGYMPPNLGKIDFRQCYAVGDRLLITHGDDFDKIMPRSQIFMKAFRLMHEIRVKLGARPVHVAEYAKKWKAFYRVLRNNVMINAVNFAAENGYPAVCCGHTHFAEDMVVNGIRYINTGAWTEYPAFYLHITPDNMILDRIDQSHIKPRGESPIPKYVKSSTPINNASRSIIFSNQYQGIAGHTQTAQQHGGYSYQGIEQAAHGDRDADGVIQKSKSEIL